MRLKQLVGCDTGPCPKVFDDGDEGPDAVVQGYLVTDPDLLAQAGRVPEGEAVVRIPRSLLLQAAAAMTSAK